MQRLPPGTLGSTNGSELTREIPGLRSAMKVAAPLVQQIGAQPNDTIIIASGTSCRHQIEHLTPVRPKHMAELLAEALVDQPSR
jgi:Fe-S oxidoreductase